MENIEKVHFLLLLWSLIQKCMKIKHLRNSRVRGHLVTLAKCHMSVVCQHFQRASPLKLPVQFHLKFHMQPAGKGGKNVYISGPGHVTKMVDMPIYGINVKKSPEPLGRLP